MTTTQSNPPSGDPASSTDKVPVLGDGFKEQNTQAVGSGNWEGTADVDGNSAAEKMRLLALGKRKEEKVKVPVPLGVTSHPAPTFRSGSPSAVPPRSASPKYLPASPGRLQQASPRVTSPTSSLIFERNVQEDVAPVTTSPAIPAHITTENHIPPVLEMASKAITDDHLDPDSVEIVTHAAHLPAAAVVTAASDIPLTPLHPTMSMSSSGPSATERDATFQGSLHEHGASPVAIPGPMTNSIVSGGSPPIGSDAGTNPASEDGSSTFGGNISTAAMVPNYGSIADTTDVRRLSFISFADVVHAEQVAGGDAASIRDSVIVSPAAAATSPPLAAARSPSPMRSPASPSLSAASGTGSGNVPLGEADGSPSGRAHTGSPSRGLGGGSLQSSTLLHSVQGNSPPIGNTGGELTIETMRQALRKTGSGDLSGVRSSIVFGEVGSEDEKR